MNLIDRYIFREAFARLHTYHGDLILEIKPGFWDDLPEALTTTRSLVAQAAGREGR